MSNLLRPQSLVPLFTALTALAASTYHLDSWHRFAHEEHEARMDELEGTIRGHIGYGFDATFMFSPGVQSTQGIIR